ncbi:unnamed protein product [Adineta steineri]|uniref:Uncharacterized protein n=1 Tax=Adineta steineri TaxID=433720 RepID=A0A814WDS5_9BILA|nr:unnamed protein product [Adineta steineri]
MIGVDQKHTVGLMQQQEQPAPPLTSSFINQLQSSITTDSSNSSIFDTNYHQKKFISSSRVRTEIHKNNSCLLLFS